MIGKARHHRRGSVVIMVVGLLTLLAMIGSTLVIVSFLDRREARSVAATVPMKNVARSVLGRVLVKLPIDLYISDNGTPNVPSDDVLYGLADTAAKRIDYPSETTDKHLASFDLHYDPALGDFFWWKHVSNIPGDLLLDEAPPYVRPPLGVDPDASPDRLVRLDYPHLADTDRAGYTVGGTRYWGDSLLRDSGMRDSAGRYLMVAERIIDASGLLPVNLAHRPAPATPERVMPITDLSLLPLVGVGGADAVRNARIEAYPADTIVNYWTNYALRPNNVGADRRYSPFTVEDMLAAAWFTTPPRLPTGRLYSVLGVDPFAAARPYLTVASVGRIGVMPGRAKVEQKYKADLNKADFDALYNAFYNLLEGAYSDEAVADRRRTAAQLAVNVIDFRDADSNITREKDPNETATFYGVERQPFIVEAAYRREEVGGNMENFYAIELYNPFRTAIDISGWKVKIGADPPVDIVIAGNAIPADGRLVIVNDAGVQAFGPKVTIDTLDLTQEVLILRPIAPGDTTNYVVVDSISKADFRDKRFDVDPDPGDKAKIECLRRDDALANAFYALPIYNNAKIEVDITAPANPLNNLGKPNGEVTLSIDDVQPCPVYVRNGNFINVADVCRILAVGPGEEVSLNDGLTKPTSLYNGRLDMGGGIPGDPFWGEGIPVIPLGCMPWDFLMVHSPMADEVDNDDDGQPDSADTDGGEDLVYGRVNINTAPHEVLQCLPGLAGLPNPLWNNMRDKIVRELICYRDLDDNTVKTPIVPGSGLPGLAYRTAGRADALGIANLRNEPGFASPGEIVLPLLARASQGDIAVPNRLPNETYDSNEAPTNYVLSLAQDGTTLIDDGLSTADADRVSGDLVKHHVYASWLSNHVAVRSDVYLAYIAVYASTAEGSGAITSVGGTTLRDDTKSWKDDKWLRNRAQEELLHVVVFLENSGEVHQIRRIVRNDATTLTVATAWSAVPAGNHRYQILSVKRRYVALIDRSNVRSVRDRPEVLMFAEVR